MSNLLLITIHLSLAFSWVSDLLAFLSGVSKVLLDLLILARQSSYSKSVCHILSLHFLYFCFFFFFSDDMWGVVNLKQAPFFSLSLSFSGWGQDDESVCASERAKGSVNPFFSIRTRDLCVGRWFFTFFLLQKRTHTWPDSLSYLVMRQTFVALSHTGIETSTLFFRYYKLAMHENNNWSIRNINSYYICTHRQFHSQRPPRARLV